jgi:hypothetical protein
MAGWGDCYAFGTACAAWTEFASTDYSCQPAVSPVLACCSPCWCFCVCCPLFLRVGVMHGVRQVQDWGLTGPRCRQLQDLQLDTRLAASVGCGCHQPTSHCACPLNFCLLQVIIRDVEVRACAALYLLLPGRRRASASEAPATGWSAFNIIIIIIMLPNQAIAST